MSRAGRLIVLLSVAPLLIASAVATPSPRRAGPKLLVLIVFDQLRGDYLSRWRDLFGPDGFRKLTSEGVWFTNCHFPYSMTVTGSGHASLATGALPSQHGIVENDWFDRQAGKMVYCSTFGDRYQMVPAGSKSKSGKGDGGAPTRLLVPTLGEVVKETTKDRGKVIGIALKDRGGVLPTGAKADICYWYDDSRGAFVTSTYYTDLLPRYMTQFNAQKYADRWFGKDWTRLRTDCDYAAYSSVDDAPGEGDGKKMTRAFPHDMTGGDKTPASKFYNCVYASPYGNDLTWAATKVIIEHEQLGRDEATDFLAVSFSSNDAVGHLWGPDSQEVLDITLRSDLLMADMIRYLDAQVGRDNYLLALSSDHGVCPLPEVARWHHPLAARINPKEVVKALDQYLNGKYGIQSKWIDATTGAGLYLRYPVIKAAGKTRQEIENACRDWLLELPYVRTVYTRTQVESNADGDPLLAKIRAGYHPERSPDLMPVLHPYVFLSEYKGGTTHGSPYEYDTHVPLILFGGGVAPQIRGERAMPQLAAILLARSLGRRMPAAATEAPADVLPGR